MLVPIIKYSCFMDTLYSILPSFILPDVASTLMPPRLPWRDYVSGPPYAHRRAPHTLSGLEFWLHQLLMSGEIPTKRVKLYFLMPQLHPIWNYPHFDHLLFPTT
ncbi:hypothetical protein AB205_0043310 [Aquarana catesbeiana]|uniref:Uncharacterized protein n=1 Tax=Aquarana catesbeiana TaxID=8400 RepID=A0A2G9RNT4_AQUCT|nr:hypothetical protein AB205_0043310 [Aquarana catesbeiana]